MKKVLWIIICIFLVGCQKKAPLSDKENFKIVVASDLHYFAKENYEECEWFEEYMLYGDGKMVTYADEILDAFAQRMEEIQPDLILLTGDLSYNGEKNSHEQLAEKLKQMEKNGTRVAVIDGNHDIDNMFAKGYGKDDYIDLEYISGKDFLNIYKDLGYDLAVSQDKNSLSYRIDLNEQYSLLILDTARHEMTGSILNSSGRLTENTYAWTENELKNIQKENRVPLIAMHHNLAIHNSNNYANYTINENEKIAALFKEYNVPLVLSGHIHLQSIKQIDEIFDVVTTSLVDNPLQYGLIEISKDSITYDNESLNISVNSADYFDTVTYNRFEENVNYKEDEKKKVLEMLVLANRHYFAGTMDEVKDEILASEGYQIIKNDENAHYWKYLQTMLENDQEQNHLKISIEK